MILYRKEPYPLQMRNVMLLDDVKSGGVVYVGKATYDQALLLSGRMDGDPKRVLSVLSSPKTEAYKATLGLSGLVESMMSTMPKPLNMIAPFLIYCVQNQGIQWNAEDRVFAYGILHQYSQMIDFNAMTLVPTEVRNNVVIPTALLKSYETSWEDLCQSLKDLVMLAPVAQSITAPAPSVQSTSVQQSESVKQAASTPAQTQAVPTQSQATPAQTQVAPTQQSGEETMEDKIARIAAENKKKIEEAKQKAEEARKKRQAVTGGSAPKPVTASPTTSQAGSEAGESKKILAEFDI